MRVHTGKFFQKKYGGRGASGRRGDRPTTCTVLEASQERVRYASAPGCPGHGRASLALTDLHTHHRQRRSAGTLKCTVLYTYHELPPRVTPRATGDLRGIHKRTRLRRRIDAGGPLAGPPSRPGAPRGLTCCSAEPLQSSFCGIMGGLSTLRLNATRSSTAIGGLRLFIILPNLCKKNGQKTPVRSQYAPRPVCHLPPVTMTPAGSGVPA